MTEMDAHNPAKQDTPLPETEDVEQAEDVWETLVALGEAIGREWQSPLSGVELLSATRR
jgi:hypothetical protein